MTERPSPIGEVAVALARRGFRVFPCHHRIDGERCSCGDPKCNGKNRAKHPRTPHGFKDGTTDLERVRAWWRKWPHANIGIWCGPWSNLLVIDVDGDEGRASLGRLAAELGPLPETLTASTGRTGGGEHRYFSWPRGEEHIKNAVAFAPGLDTRTDGGYVVAPPSQHISGRYYAWVNDLEPAELPPEWVARIKAGKPKATPKNGSSAPAPKISPASSGWSRRARAALEGECANVAKAREGTWNDTLNAAAYSLGQLVGCGEAIECEVEQALIDASASGGWAATIDDWSKRARKTIASGLRAGMASPRQDAPRVTSRATCSERPKRESRGNGGAPPPLPPPPTDADAPGEPAASGEPAIFEAPEEPWHSRQPLGTADCVPTLEPELLPATIRPWLVDVADHACFPLEMPAVPALVALSSLIGRKLGVRPEPSSTWTVVPNLWGGLVARPGWKKSMAIETGTSPLGPLISDAREDYERRRLEVEARRIGIEAQLASAKRRTRDPVDPAELEQLLRERERCRVAARRYMTSDATVEKLGEILRDNPRGILLQRDELAGWITAMSRPDRAGDREFYLEAWSGTGSFTVDRIQRGTIYIPALCLSVVGSIQPGKLLAHIRSATASGGGADGLLQRIQLLVWPDRLPEYHHCDRRPDREARDRAFQAFALVDRLDAGDVGAERYEDSIPFLRFDEGAQALATEWQDALEVRLRSDELEPTPAFESHLAKYRSLMPSLALVFHLADNPDAGPIGIESVMMAIAWCRFLEVHARKVYAVELAPGLAAAELLAQKIEARAIDHCSSLRDIYRAHWEGLNTPEVVAAGLHELERAGWLRLASESTGGRPTTVIHLHPELRS